MRLFHLVAAGSALWQSLIHARSLGVRGVEWTRYLQKSLNLALCYDELIECRTALALVKVGRAAFLCCAYDVVTDWRSFNPFAQVRFAQFLDRLVPSFESRQLALSLYAKEVANAVADDGLERGPIALRFVLQMADQEQQLERRWGHLQRIGHLLQIVDDVLDYEEDISRSELNCLTSPSRPIYLRMLLADFHDDEVERLFGKDAVILRTVISRARQKAAVLLHTCEPAPAARQASRVSVCGA